MATPIVEFESVDRSFGGGLDWRMLARLQVGHHKRRKVLTDISFTVDPGQWLAIMGANGSGKTTILKMIAGLVRPEHGTIRVNSMDIRTDHKAARRAVGYSLADERSFQWRLSGRENLRFFASLESLRGDERRARVEQLLHAFDLDAYAERPFGEFSAGVRQRLAIARALLRRPQLLLLDEPTRSLDVSHGTAVWQVIQQEMHANGGSVVVATHRLDEATEYCDALRVIKNGSLIEESDNYLMHQPGVSLPLAGYSVTMRGLTSSGISALGATDGLRNIEFITVAGGDVVIEAHLDAGSASIEALLAVLAQQGGTVESVREQLAPATVAHALPRRHLRVLS